MRIGLSLGHSVGLRDAARLAQQAEQAGLDSLWVSEAYGSDAVSVLGHLAAVTTRVGLGAAVLQMPARTPAATAMAAMTLDHLSEGRLLLGLGSSGPQVCDGWHGAEFGSPLARTREYTDIVRAIVARCERLTYTGRHYTIPRAGTQAQPLKSSLKPYRDQIPIYLAGNGPRNIALTARIANGWLPAFYSPGHTDAYRDLLAPGLAERHPDLGPLRVVATVNVAAGGDLASCRDRLRPAFALYLGGMGARGKNFYVDIVSRLGYEGAALRIQDLYLDGHKAEAIAAVPDALIDELALAGPIPRIRDRLAAWRESGVDVVTLKTTDLDLCRRLLETL